MERNELNEIKEMLNEVTVGPWVSIVEDRDQESGSSFIQTGDRNYDINFFKIKVADQDFIAAARNLIPKLVEEIERLQEKISTKYNG